MADIDDTSKSDAALRAEVRAWLDANREDNLPPLRDKWNPPAATKAWIAKVIDAKWAVPTWPREWGGRELTPEQADLIADEFARVGAPGTRLDRMNLAACIVMAIGSEEL